MFSKNERLGVIFSHLDEVETFADIGADHGYIAREMLRENKCQKAIVTDISAECLKKAEKILAGEYDGRYTMLVTDGLKGVPKSDEVLIAGMGGEIISSIIEKADFLPEIFVLQPMKNSDVVRRTLLKCRYKLIIDYTFKDKKFYDLIKAVKGKDSYTDDELTFGRDNLREKNSAFKEMLCIKRAKLSLALKAAKASDLIEREIERIDRILK